MKKRIVLMLALPASLTLHTIVSWHQSSLADASTTTIAQKQSIDTSFDPVSFSDSRFGAAAAAQTGLDVAAILPGLLPVPKIVPMPASVPAPAPAPLHPLIRQPAQLPVQTSPTRTMALNSWGSEIKKTKVKKEKIKSGVSAAAAKAEEVQEKFVALTFDDGPSPVYTPMILAILKREGIHATFCVIGREAKRHPEVVRQILAEGHKIADHSMNHDEHLDQRTDKKMEAEILGARDLIQSIAPGTEVEFYRAPAGNMNLHQRQLIRSWGLKPLGWSVDTKDWQKPGVDQIIATVKQQLHPGCLILMHDSGGDRSETVEALQKVIPLLKKDGYQFVFPG